MKTNHIPVSNQSPIFHAPSFPKVKVNKLKYFIFKIFYHIGNKLTTGNTSKLFKAKLIHLKKDAHESQLKSIFDKDFFASTRNIGRRSVLVQRKDVKATEKLRKLLENGENKSIHIDPIKTPESRILDGICAGMTLDIAVKYLINRQNIADIIEKNKKGGSAKAAANQAIYAFIDAKLPYSVIFLDLIKNLKEIAKTEVENPLFQVNFDDVGQALLYLDPALSLSSSPYAAEYSLSKTPNPNSFNATFAAFMSEEYRLRRENSAWLSHEKGNPFHIKNLEAFKKDMLDTIDQKYEKRIQKATSETVNQLNQKKLRDIHTFQWVFSILEYRQSCQAKKLPPNSKQTENNSKKRGVFRRITKKSPSPITHYTAISNPSISSTFSLLTEELFKDKRYHAVVCARGLKLESVNMIMGSRWAHSSDHSYLQNISNLEPGVYSVSIAHKTGLHLINYIKVDESEGYIIDSIGAQIRCKDARHTVEQFEKHLALIPEPDVTAFAVKGESTHRLHFQKFVVPS